MVESAQEDPLFDRAVEIVLETQRGSVSLLQRRLAIGYTRASRLIELMGLAGIIGGHKGSVAREVVMTLEEWQAMKKLAQADAAANEPKSAAQPKLFEEPVTAREIVGVAKEREAENAPGSETTGFAPADLRSSRACEDTSDAEAPPFDVAEEDPAVAAASAEISAEATMDEAEDEGVNETPIERAAAEAVAEPEVHVIASGEAPAAMDEDEGEDAIEVVEDEAEDDSEEDESAEDAEAEKEYEYEYEYVEVEEGQEVGEEYEVVDEAAAPDVVVKGRARKPESAGSEEAG
jgi:S-DNA-T family DNA segregation ATPase FtsK/SpoIIIE